MAQLRLETMILQRMRTNVCCVIDITKEIIGTQTVAKDINPFSLKKMNFGVPGWLNRAHDSTSGFEIQAPQWV